MKCSQCGAELTPGEVFCGECGQPVQSAAVAGRICPQCNTPVEAGKRFCGSCGYDLTVATASPQTSATVPAPPQATAGASTNPSRTVLVLGLTTVVAIFLLAALGLWLWLGSNQQADANTQNKQANANIQKANATIAGVWNCDYLPEASEADHAQMNLTQNGSAVTGTMTSEEETIAIAGTFDGEVLAITSPRVVAPLTVSPGGQTMKGEAEDGGVKATVVCRR